MAGGDELLAFALDAAIASLEGPGDLERFRGAFSQALEVAG